MGYASSENFASAGSEDVERRDGAGTTPGRTGSGQTRSYQHAASAAEEAKPLTFAEQVLQVRAETRIADFNAAVKRATTELATLEIAKTKLSYHGRITKWKREALAFLQRHDFHICLDMLKSEYRGDDTWERSRVTLWMKSGNFLYAFFASTIDNALLSACMKRVTDAHDAKPSSMEDGKLRADIRDPAFDDRVHPYLIWKELQDQFEGERHFASLMEGIDFFSMQRAGNEGILSFLERWREGYEHLLSFLNVAADSVPNALILSLWVKSLYSNGFLHKQNVDKFQLFIKEQVLSHLTIDAVTTELNEWSRSSMRFTSTAGQDGAGATTSSTPGVVLAAAATTGQTASTKDERAATRKAAQKAKKASKKAAASEAAAAGGAGAAAGTTNKDSRTCHLCTQVGHIKASCPTWLAFSPEQREALNALRKVKANVVRANTVAAASTTDASVSTPAGTHRLNESGIRRGANTSVVNTSVVYDAADESSEDF
jgi:hypothetical protein